MERSNAEFKAFLKEDPPRVTRIRVRNNESMYVISTNGNHRLFAAELRGLEEIPVECHSEVPSLTSMRLEVRNGGVRVCGGRPPEAHGVQA